MENKDFEEISGDGQDSGAEEKDCETKEEAGANDDQNQDEKSLRIKLKDLEEKYLRVHADFENVKKRIEREKLQALEYSHEKIAKDLLPTIDSLERALDSAVALNDPKENPVAEGIKLTLDNLKKALNKHGVEPISCDGDFDPNMHDAIMHVQDLTKEDGSIARVLQSGYKYKDRILRPAMVAITKN